MTIHKFVLLPVFLCAGGLASGAGVELSDRFYQAIRNNNLSSLKALMKSQDINSRDKRGATPLMVAAAFGNAEEVKLLLDAGADVNAKDDFDATPLIWAAGDPVKSRMLIEHGADVKAQSKQGRTPLMVAARRDGSAQLVGLLLAKGADARAHDATGNTALHLAAQMGDVETMRPLIDKGAEIEATDSFFGITPLGNAARSNKVEAVRLLLAKGADVNAATTHQPPMRNGLVATGKMTPLLWAAPYGSAEMIRTLLNAGAEVNAKDVRGMTPIMLAVASETQDVDVVGLLLKAHADVNAVSAIGETALDWAQKFGDRAVIARLQAAGARQGVPYSAPQPPHTALPLDSRQALEKGIGLLQRSSTEYFKQSGCVGCHHQPMAAMAVRAARSAGVAVDEAASREQLSVMKSQAAAAEVSMLQGMDKGVPDVALSILQGLAAAGYPPDNLTDSIVAAIACLQRPNGSWAGAVGQSRAPIEEGDIARTVRTARMLQIYGIPARQPEFDNRIAQARAWLLQANPRTSDDRAMLLLGLSWTGADRRKIRDLSGVLIAQQREDGGWAGNPNLGSDAFATGEVLYALRESNSLTAGDPVHQRGVRYLLTTQYPDGSWYVRSRAVKLQPYFQSGFPFDHDQWISAAATAWASMAVAAAVESPQTAALR